MKRERERETLRDRFNFMRSIIVKEGEISESEFILLLDEKGIGTIVDEIYGKSDFSSS